jgi:hypothetical protein
MGRTGFLLVPLLALILISGCTRVTFSFPVGEPVREDLSGKLDGIWIHAQASAKDSPRCSFHVQYLKDGRLHIGIVGWEEDEFMLHQLHGLLTTLDGKTYLHVLDPSADDAEPDYDLLLLAWTGENELTLWAARGDTFRDAVKKGVLQGDTTVGEGGEVWIDEPKAGVERFLAATNPADAFHLDRPVYLLRRIWGWKPVEEKS